MVVLVLQVRVITLGLGLQVRVVITIRVRVLDQLAKYGESGYRSRYLSHAKRALSHLS